MQTMANGSKKQMTARQIETAWTRLNNARRTARQAAADFAFNNRPLSPEQVEEWKALGAKADAAQDACDKFYAEHGSIHGGSLRC